MLYNGLMNTRINTFEENDLKMKWFRFGSGKRIFVIIPGLSVQSVMGSADQIADAYKMFADDFTVYVFDRRENVKEGYSISDMARDTAYVIRALGLSKINVFGASQGGMIALKMAIDNPDLVEKLILGSTSARVTDKMCEAVNNWIALAKEGKSEDLFLAFGEAIYPKEVYEQFRDIFISMSSSVTREELDRFVILASNIKSFDVVDELDKIVCPVLIIGSFEDKVLDSDATMEIAEKLDRDPNFRLYMYNGYGHAAFDVAPDYKDRIMAFL